MTIWIIAIVLLVGCAVVGYSQGAVRVGFSFVGLVIGALVALPLGNQLRRLCPSLGIEEPLWVAVLPPVVAFVVVLVVFKSAAQFVHRKIDLYYKYKAGELRQVLWLRLNSRLGLCLGLVNGSIYLVLAILVLYPVSYLTTQTANETEDPKWLRLVNAVGWDLQKTGLAKAAAAVAPVPEAYYEVADLVGLVHQNPLLYGLISRYPPVLTVAEKSEFIILADEQGLGSQLLRRAPITELAANPNVQSVVKNWTLLEQLWSHIGPKLGDFRAYLETGGRSPEYYPERILGRWVFDNYSSVSALKRSRANLTATFLRFMRQTYYPAAAKTTVLATPDGKLYLREFVRFVPSAAPTAGTGRRSAPTAPGHVTQPVTLEGHWLRQNGAYELSFTERGRQFTLTATVEADKLTISGEAVPLAFQRH